MKNNNLIIIFVLIISLFVNIGGLLAYLFILKPENIEIQQKLLKVQQENLLINKEQQSGKEMFDRTLACQSSGDSYVNNEQQSRGSNEVILSHQTAYSPEYNACILLYRSQLRYGDETTTFNQILNLNTRKEIYYFTYTRKNQKPYSKTIDLGNEEEYNNLVRNIFGAQN